MALPFGKPSRSGGPNQVDPDPSTVRGLRQGLGQLRGGGQSAHQQYAAWRAAGSKGASGANAPGASNGQPDSRVDQLRGAISQGKMPPPLTPPVSMNGRVGTAAGSPTPVSGGETAFSGPAAGAGSSPGPSPGLLALAGQAAQAKPGQMTQFQGPPAQQGGSNGLSTGSGGSGPTSIQGGLAGMMGSMGPVSGGTAVNDLGYAGPGPQQPGAGPNPWNSPGYRPPTGYGQQNGGAGGPLPSTGEGGGGWQAPGGGGGPMPWLGGGFHTNPQPIGTLPGAPGFPGWGQQPPGGPFLQRPTVPTTNLGPIGNAPRINPGAPGGGLHPGLGGFGSGMF